MSELLLDLVGEASPPAYTWTETFENGVNGASLGTTGYSSFDLAQGSNAVPTFTNASPVFGSLCGQFSFAPNEIIYATKYVNTDVNYYVRLYVKVSAAPVNLDLPIVSVGYSTPNGNTIYGVFMSTTGALRTVINTGATIATSTGTYHGSAWYRLDLALGPATGQTLKIYSLAGRLLETLSFGSVLTGKSFDRIWLGSTVSQASLLNSPIMYVDGIEASPQPLPSPPFQSDNDPGGFTDAASRQILVLAIPDSDNTAHFTESASVDKQNVYNVSFDTGTNGGSIWGASGTNWTVGTNNLTPQITYDSLNAAEGALGAFIQTNANASAYIQATASQNGSTHYARLYFKLPPTYPTGNDVYLAGSYDGSNTFLGGIKTNFNTGTLSIVNSANTALATTTTILKNYRGWWRAEWDITGTTQTVRIYKGGLTTPIETISSSAPNTAIGTIRYGSYQANSSVDYWIDEIAGNPNRTPGPAGGTVYQENFEGAANGTVLSVSGVHSFDNAGSQGTYSTTQKYNGAASYSILSKNQEVGSWTLPAARTSLYARVYYYATQNPSADISVMTVGSARFAAGIENVIYHQTTGKLNLLGRGGTSVTTANALSINQWYRIEWDITGSGHTLRYYLGENSSPIETISTTQSPSAFTDVAVGNNNNSVTSFLSYWDAPRVSITQQPGNLTGQLVVSDTGAFTESASVSIVSQPARVNEETFDEGVNGSVVPSYPGLTASNGTITSNSANFTFSTFTYKGSGLSGKSSPATSSEQQYISIRANAATDHYVRFYVYFTNVPSSGNTYSIMNGNGTTTTMNITSTGKLNVDGVTGFTTLTSAWWRIEYWHGNGTTSTTVIYAGNSLVPTETLNGSTTGTFTPLDFRFGYIPNTGGANVSTVYMDDVGYGNAGWLGPYLPNSKLGSETVSGADIVAQVLVSKSAGDTFTATDSGIPVMPITAGDTATAVEATLPLAIASTVNDTLTLTDAGGVTARGGNFFDGDSGLFTERAATDRGQSSGDLSAFTESQSLSAMALSNDMGHTSELAEVVKYTWRFLPPPQPLRYPIRGSLIITMYTGLTVLKKNGTYRIVSDPLAEDVEAADVAYLGGRAYVVDDAEIAALTAAGYGAYVALVPEPS